MRAQGCIARLRNELVLTCLLAGAVRLTGKHWDRTLTQSQRLQAAAAAQAEVDEALAAPRPAPAPDLLPRVQGQPLHVPLPSDRTPVAIVVGS